METRSEADLAKVGASTYSNDPTTSLLWLCYKIDDHPVEQWAPQPDEYGVRPESFIEAISQGGEFHAHNAAFEKDIWRNLCVPRFGWPDIPDELWHCTAARSAAMGLPRDLGRACLAVGVAQQKDTSGRALMLKMCKPRKPSKNNPAKWHETPPQMAALGRYCCQDVLATEALHKATTDLPPNERRVWLADQKINGLGVPIDLELIEQAIQLEEKHRAALLAELAQKTRGVVTTGRQIERMISWLNGRGVNIDNLQKQTVAKALQQNGLAPDARRVLEIRGALSRSSTDKLKAMRRRTDADGRARGAHLYQGAGPGRWAGRGVQFQNVPATRLKPQETNTLIELIRDGNASAVELFNGSVTDSLVDILRASVKATQGKRLIVSDFAAIEARVLAWLADETQLLELFYSGGDPYGGLAADIYNRPAASIDKDRRAVGKQAVLGLGYQMGKDTFRKTCQKYGMNLSQKFCSRVVELYRARFKRITSFWYDLEKAAIAAVNNPGKVYPVGSKIAYCQGGRYLMAALPSQRKIFYPDPQVGEQPAPWGGTKIGLSYMSVNSTTNKYERERTYGGKLAENVTQGTARDFFAESLLRLDEAGYPVIFHVHDEAVVEVEKHFGSVGEVERIMEALPAWGNGCPIKAEGFETERFRKDG